MTNQIRVTAQSELAISYMLLPTVKSNAKNDGDEGGDNVNDDVTPNRPSIVGTGLHLVAQGVRHRRFRRKLFRLIL